MFCTVMSPAMYSMKHSTASTYGRRMSVDCTISVQASETDDAESADAIRPLCSDWFQRPLIDQEIDVAAESAWQRAGLY